MVCRVIARSLRRGWSYGRQYAPRSAAGSIVPAILPRRTPYARFPLITRLWNEGANDELGDDVEFGLQRVLDGIAAMIG